MMDRIFEMNEVDYLYGRRSATLFKMGWGIRIIGFKNGGSFDLRVLTIGPNPKLIGLGQRALNQIRPIFNEITVNEIHEEVLHFWIKMKERGLINKLGSIKGELNYDIARK